MLDRMRLRQHAMKETKFFGKTPPIGQPAWWMSLYNMSLPVRAELFYKRYKSESVTTQKKMRDFAGEIGLLTPDFANYMRTLESQP